MIKIINEDEDIKRNHSIDLHVLRNNGFNYPIQLIPDNLQELIDRLYDTDNRKVGRLATKERKKGEFDEGLIYQVKDAIQEYNRSDYVSISPSDARADRILRTQDSDGRRTARRMR